MKHISLTISHSFVSVYFSVAEIRWRTLVRIASRRDSMTWSKYRNVYGACTQPAYRIFDEMCTFHRQIVTPLRTHHLNGKRTERKRTMKMWRTKSTHFWWLHFEGKRQRNVNVTIYSTDKRISNEQRCISVFECHSKREMTTMHALSLVWGDGEDRDIEIIDL